MTPIVPVSHAGARQPKQQTGYPPDVIEQVMGRLPDPIDLNRDAAILGRSSLRSISSPIVSGLGEVGAQGHVVDSAAPKANGSRPEGGKE